MSEVGTDTRTRFEERVRPLLDPLLGYFARRIEPTADAGECVTETLLVLWRRSAEMPRDDDEFRAFAYGVAARVAANHRRGALRRSALAERIRAHITIVPAPEDGRGVDLQRALERLPAQDRELLTLVAWDGLSLHEAAAALGISAAAARKRASRARQRLRGWLA